MTFGRICKKDLRRMWDQYTEDLRVYVDDFNAFWYDREYLKRGIYVGMKLIGFVITRRGEVSEFYIEPDQRRKRYGAEAVRMLSEEMGDFRYYVLARNKAGQAFWRTVTPNRHLIATDGRGEWYGNPKTNRRSSSAKPDGRTEKGISGQTETEGASRTLFYQLRLFPDVAF